MEYVRVITQLTSATPGNMSCSNTSPIPDKQPSRHRPVAYFNTDHSNVSVWEDTLPGTLCFHIVNLIQEAFVSEHWETPKGLQRLLGVTRNTNLTDFLFLKMLLENTESVELFQTSHSSPTQPYVHKLERASANGLCRASCTRLRLKRIPTESQCIIVYS